MDVRSLLLLEGPDMGGWNTITLKVMGISQNVSPWKLIIQEYFP